MPQVVAIFVASSDDRILIWPVIGVIAGCYWFYKGFRLLQRKRLILNTPASKIRSASMGLVEISGLAVGPYLMTSPCKQADCYYYHTLVWELKQRGKNSEWVKVAEETLHVPFYIDDNTDKVLVDPRGAEMDLHCDFKEEYHRAIFFEGAEMTSSVAGFLARHGVDSSRRLKIEEYCIKPKNFLFILGTLSQNPGIDATIPPVWAEPASRPVLHSTAPETSAEVIRLTDDPSPVHVTEMTQQQKIAAALMKAGITNPAAWSAAAAAGSSSAAAAAQPAPSREEIAQPVETSTFDLHPPVVLMKGSHEPAFFISWRSQRDVVASLGWKSSLMIWGGPALTLGCTYFLLARFGVL